MSPPALLGPVLSLPFPSHGVCIQVLEQVTALHTSLMARLELLPRGMLEAPSSVPPPWTSSRNSLWPENSWNGYRFPSGGKGLP